MYEIYAYPYGNPDAKLLLYRPNDPQALVLSPKLTREVSKGGSLVFTMTRDHAQYDMLQKLSTVVQVRRDGKEIWRGRVLKHEADFYNRRVVYCEGALSYFNDSSITPFNYKGNLRQFLQHLIDAHNDQVKSKMKCFQLGTVTAALGNLVVQFGDADQYGVGEDYGKVWDILDKLVLKVFGGYFYCSFDSSTGLNVLNYCDQAVEAKRQTAQKIEYGRNLLNLSETTDATDLYTRIYPIGNKHTVDTSKWYYKLMWWRDTSKDKHEERWGIMETDAATVAQYLPASGYSYNLQEGWIQNDGIRVMDGSSMVNIQSNAISITDGMGSCSISSGAITFNGIRNKQELWYNSETTFGAQTIRPSGLSSYSALLILFRSQKGGTWFAGGGNAGLVSMIVPVNGVEMSMVYPWNTVHKRSVTVYDDRIVFGSGYERTSSYSGTTVLGIWSFNLQNPGGDGWSEDSGMCVPYKIYGFM